MEEILAFFGFLYFRGALSQNNVQLKYLFNPVQGHHVYSSIMSRNRFIFLKRCISYDSFETRAEKWKKDRFAAFKVVFESFNDQCTKHFVPDDYLSLDETLYATRQQINFRSYNKGKPARYGLLYRSICSARRPYIHFTNIYAGKPTEIQSEHYIQGGNDELVLSLVNGLSRRAKLDGRNISMDQLYGSIPVAKALLERNITVISTLNQNRKGLPDEIKNIKERGEFSVKSCYETSSPLSLHSYVVKTKSTGKRNVLLLSTHNVYRGVTKDDKRKPYIYKIYDFTKSGVDIADQMMSSCTTSSKSKRWTNIALSHCLDCCCINANTIYGLNVAKKESRDFAWDLAMALAKPFVQARSINGLTTPVRAKLSLFLGSNELEEQVVNRNDEDGKCKECLQDSKRKGQKEKKNKLYRLKSQCSKCDGFVCKKHSDITCRSCILKMH